MAAHLAAQHHPVVADAALRLRFSSEPQSSVSPPAGTATGEALVARDRQPFVPTNLDYSEADRFFGGPSERPTGAIENRYQVRATLETRDGAKVLWRGQASATLTERNEQRLAAALAEALADTVGRTLDSQGIAAPAPVAAAPEHPSTSLSGLRMPGLRLPELAERR